MWKILKIVLSYSVLSVIEKNNTIEAFFNFEVPTTSTIIDNVTEQNIEILRTTDRPSLSADTNISVTELPKRTLSSKVKPVTKPVNATWRAPQGPKVTTVKPVTKSVNTTWRAPQGPKVVSTTEGIESGLNLTLVDENNLDEILVVSESNVTIGVPLILGTTVAFNKTAITNTMVSTNSKQSTILTPAGKETIVEVENNSDDRISSRKNFAEKPTLDNAEINNTTLKNNTENVISSHSTLEKICIYLTSCLACIAFSLLIIFLICEIKDAHEKWSFNRKISIENQNYQWDAKQHDYVIAF